MWQTRVNNSMLIILFLFSMKAGRVVILLAGRHASKKAIIVKQYDDGKKVSIPLHYTIAY